MFCGNCGTQNSDNAAFCKNCGAQLNAAPQQPQQPVYQQPVYQQQYYAAPKKPLNTKLIGIIAGIAAAVILAVVLLIVLLGGGVPAGGATPQEVIENFTEASYDGDAAGMINQFPEATHSYMASLRGYDNIDELIDSMKESLDDEFDEMNSSGISYDMYTEIYSIEELWDDDLYYTWESYSKSFDLNVTAACKVNALLTLEVQGMTVQQSMQTFYVVEIDGIWYMDVYRVNSIF